MNHPDSLVGQYSKVMKSYKNLLKSQVIIYCFQLLLDRKAQVKGVLVHYQQPGNRCPHIRRPNLEKKLEAKVSL